MSDQKTAQQITQEWQAIELSRAGGRMPIIEALLSRAQDAPQGDRRLVETIDMLYGTLLSYHEEMGVLIAALRDHSEAEAGLRGALGHYAELRHYDYAGRLWSGDPDEHEDAQVDFGEIARAALAQGGGTRER